ncbi:MAG TPA: hypothetical protein VME70_10560 [Mycobacteriales bacterium]|nr:hypothetical protein [Mycobacteriales bacterium]
MDPYLVVIIVLGGLLLIVTAVMEWIGLVNLVTPSTGPRYQDCGHLRVSPTSPHSSCWRCRHRSLDHVVHPLHH